MMAFQDTPSDTAMKQYNDVKLALAARDQRSERRPHESDDAERGAEEVRRRADGARADQVRCPTLHEIGTGR